jgi:hypothetical protein
MKDKTKELADSVGAVYPVLLMGRSDGVLFTEFELETFVERIRAEEREACAKVCDDLIEQRFGKHLSFDMIATAIRARGNT